VSATKLLHEQEASAQQQDRYLSSGCEGSGRQHSIKVENHSAPIEPYYRIQPDYNCVTNDEQEFLTVLEEFRSIIETL
jgi:hypothetical protein